MSSNNNKNVSRIGRPDAPDAEEAAGPEAEPGQEEPPARRRAEHRPEQVDVERLRRRWNEAEAELARCDARNRELESANGQLRAELIAQQYLIGKLEAELDAKQSLVEALRSRIDALRRAADRSAAVTTSGGAAADDSEPPADASEDVEIIRIDELFRHDAQRDRRPLAVLEAPDGTAYPVSKPSVKIGRASTNDICIRREFISRTHARLVVREIGAIIEDVGSKNGILVNSEPVDRRLLVDGDIVSLGGKLNLKYVELDASTRAGALREADT